MDDIIQTIRKQFIKEAQNSPLLMEDLANMEHYISESYSGRSLIELLQNADDAAAHRFYISILDKEHAIVANDGRIFTKADLYSLCRSGASTKKRKSNTIGFRGIGFKSVVNYAKQVHLISGDLSVSFSKDLTAQILPSIPNVPLIRIPHQFNGEKYINDIRDVLAKGYTTVFIFETQNEALNQEISEFDVSSLLFLKNIEELTFGGKSNKEYRIEKEVLDDNMQLVGIESEDDNRQWIVYSCEEISYAFLYEDNEAVEMSSNERVIHSFMPTRDRFCIPCKINGDFSTDPSRTKVVCDDETLITIDKGAEVMAELIYDILSKSEDTFGLIEVISKIEVNLLQYIQGKNFNDIYFERLQNLLQSKLDKKIWIKPDWLNEESFCELGKKSGGILITQEIESNIAGISNLLKTIGFSEYPIEMALETAKSEKLSRGTRLDILVKVISLTRFTMPDLIKKAIRISYLFESEESVIKTNELSDKKIDKIFFESLLSRLSDEQDFYWFAKKINITSNIPIEDAAEDDIEEEINNDDIEIPQNITDDSPQKKAVSGTVVPAKMTQFSTKKGHIKKWRSAEQNVAEYLKDLPNVLSVKDVSKMNLGYDIEVTYESGETLCIEVKSVNKIGDAFVMTNNEYSFANETGKRYALAIVCIENDILNLCLIYDPVNSLELTRRIVRWEWVCNTYSGEFQSIPYDN